MKWKIKNLRRKKTLSNLASKKRSLKRLIRTYKVMKKPLKQRRQRSTVKSKTRFHKKMIFKNTTPTVMKKEK